MHENWIVCGGAVFVFYPLLFRSRGRGTGALNSEDKLIKLILRVECPSENQTPQRKLAIIHKASAKTSKFFNHKKP